MNDRADEWSGACCLHEQHVMDSYFLTHGKYAPGPGEKQQTLT